ncbi:MAG: SpoIIE family protein phosphatase, partial [Leptospiraceae bacterium]|nr:SpoIIE family protein phosphatase [Leptospiraceae bacterium]
KSDALKTSFLLEQKKKFEFRNKSSDLGGDICVTGNLRLGSQESFRRYVVAVNGDAMGKSMQGAGGAIVMGVVVNSIMARSARHDRILDYTPEQWLTEFYEELQGVFLAFNGSMAISAVVSVIDEDSGEMWYFNAEHPYTILYRNGKASFIEEELLLRKIGLESDIPFAVQRFQLEPGDVIIMGSDGRDDIDLSGGAEIRSINEDEYLILRTVEAADANLERIKAEVQKFGELTDDLSLLRVGFRESSVTRSSGSLLEDPERHIIEIDAYDTELAESEFDQLFHQGRSLAREGNSDEALKLLKQAYDLKKDEPALNKILAVLTFKGKEYETAVDVLQKYLEHDPNIEDFWLYLSIAHKRTGNYDKALEAADKVFEINPNRVPNLIQLSDLHAKLGNHGRARIFAEKALELEPENRQAQQMMESLSARS